MFQLYLVTLVLVIPTIRWPKYAVAFCFLVIAFGCVISLIPYSFYNINSYRKGFNTGMFYHVGLVAYHMGFMNRISNYVVGILTGYLIRKYPKPS